MKLLSLHIENYGKLSDFDLNFDEKITKICEQNGYGKSTIASFIKAIFFSLPVTTKRKLSENERKKFLPWNGLSYGGYIVFSDGEDTLRAERYMTDKDDSFKLYNEKTGTLSDKYTDKIGEELFGVDIEAFERSVFIPQGISETGMNDSINAKLNNLVDSTDDINNFETAVSNISQEAKRYKLQRGLGGILYDEECNISDMQHEIERIELNRSSLSGLEEKLQEENNKKQETEKKLSDIRERIKQSATAEAEKLKRKAIAEAKTAKESAKAELEKIAVQFKNGIPDEEETTLAKSQKAELDNKRAVLEKLNGVEILLAEINTADLDNATALVEKITSKTAEFKATALSDSEVRETEEAKAFLKTAASEAEIKSASVVSQKQNKSKLPLVLSVVSAVIIVLAVALFITKVQNAGIILAATGVIILGGALFTYLKNTSKANESSERKAFLEKYCISETDFSDYCYKVKSAKEKIKKGEQRKAEIEQKRNEIQSEISELKGSAKDVLSNYLENVTEDNLSAKCNELRVNFAAAEEQKLQAEKRASEREKIITECKKIKASLEAFCEKYVLMLSNNLFENISNARNEKLRAEKLLFEANKKLGEYSVDSDTQIGKITEPLDIETLKLTESQLTEQLNLSLNLISDLNIKIKALKASDDRYSELIYERDSLIEKNGEDQKKYDLLMSAKSYLEKSKESLSNRYLETVKENFIKYSSLFSDAGLENAKIDTSLKMKIQGGGKLRDTESLSTGLLDLSGMCMRLSLCDALFKDEKPFLILDDPFTNLDEKKIAVALKTLYNLSENYQIVYFTCHKDRC